MRCLYLYIPQLNFYLYFSIIYCAFNIVEEDNEAWAVYQMWSVLPENVKNSWIEAGKTINEYDELAKSIPNKVSICFS